jgi:isopenicillin N synthase-like dioxygenase
LGRTDAITTVDLSGWYSGDPVVQLGVAAALDDSFRRMGFALVTGHGIEPSMLDEARARSLDVFALDPDVKGRYVAPTLGTRGWVPYGAEANGYLAGEETPPDLKESWTVTTEVLGRADATPNVWPDEVPAFEPAVSAALVEVEGLHLDLMEIAGVALGLDDPRYFRDRCRGALNTFNINWYPPPTGVGPDQQSVEAGQYRIGPHTDFGTITILDRQPGSGGLQVEASPGVWVDAPFVPGALTVNVGDLLEMWTGGRWRSSSHRVVMPQPDHADEELVSLLYFCEPDADVIVAPLFDGDAFAPVRAGDYLADRMAAITV